MNNERLSLVNTKLPVKKKNSEYSDCMESCKEVRLNSPRDKFKITNMADYQVDLTPEDIPCASFSKEEIGKLTVAYLKIWLKCRRINQNGNKKTQLER